MKRVFIVHCPKCGQKMTAHDQDFSYDFKKKPKKKYTRKVYWCKKDDVWVSLEVPAQSRYSIKFKRG